MPSQKLSRDQIESILRRAAELETTRALEAGGQEESGDISEGELLRLGEEAGLPAAAIEHALAEHRRGVLPRPEVRALGNTLGPGRVVVSRVVPARVELVERAVERFLREQLMTIRRHHGARIEWERAQGLWPGLVRSLDFSQRYVLASVNRIETSVAAEGEQSTSVVFDIDLSDTRRQRLARVGLRSLAAFGIVGLGGAGMFPGFGVNDVIALFTGGAFAGGLLALERKRYQQTRERVMLAPERFLDLFVQRRRAREGVPKT